MGATAIRISASDFVIPPDLRHWPLAAEGAGRIGGVRLELVAGPAGARLGACYQQTPLRVLPPFPFGPGRPSLLYLLNPTAGLMDGDGQRVELRAGPGSRAVVVGQSATRNHPAVHGLCTQQWQVHVAHGATLVVLPGPAIPFQGCR
jgi:urease accessory protein